MAVYEATRREANMQTPQLYKRRRHGNKKGKAANEKRLSSNSGYACPGFGDSGYAYP